MPHLAQFDVEPKKDWITVFSINFTIIIFLVTLFCAKLKCITKVTPSDFLTLLIWTIVETVG